MELRYRGIVFDLDGTLVDSYAALTEAINHARERHGLDSLTPDDIRNFVGDGVETLLQRAFAPAVPEGAQELFERRYGEVCCEQSRLLEEVAETLEALQGWGVRMAVCTNKPTSFSIRILDYLRVAHYFAAVIGPDLAGARKPDAKHVRRALAPTGCQENESLFVGDMPVDVLGARNSGMDVAVIASGSSSGEALREAGADYYLGRFSDLLRLVRPGREGA